MIIAYIFIIIGLIILSYYGLDILLKEWSKSQAKKAKETATQFEEMFIFFRRRVLVAMYIILPIIFGVIGYIFSGLLLVALGFAAAGTIAPLWALKLMEKQRKKKFVNQLVDALMILNSCLKGGLTLIQAFDVLAEETTPPMSQEIALLSREIKIGVILEEALKRLEKRMPSEEMTLIISAILVARETGGDLTKVFSKLTNTIRDRMKLKNLVSTLTLQSRLQAIVISLLGPLFYVAIRKMNPGHFDIMTESDIGKILLVVAVVCQILGMIMIGLFSRVKI